LLLNGCRGRIALGLERTQDGLNEIKLVECHEIVKGEKNKMPELQRQRVIDGPFYVK